MVLHREDRLIFYSNTSNGVVVEVDVRDLDVGVRFHTLGRNYEAVILACYLRFTSN